MWPPRLNSRAAARIDASDERSNSGRESAITDARRFCNAATAAEPMAPVAPVTTTVGMIYS